MRVYVFHNAVEAARFRTPNQRGRTTKALLVQRKSATSPALADTFEQARHGAQVLRLRLKAKEGPAVNPDDSTAIVETPQKKQASRGDLDQAMKEAAFAIDRTYTTPAHSSAPMEPHASVAEWNGDMLTMGGSYQMLQFNRRELAAALGIDEAKVRVLAPFVGGGFGSRRPCRQP